MQVTEIHIHPINHQSKGLIAFAHIIIDESLMLGSIGIYEKRDGGFRITYPQKGNGYVFHPVSKPLSQVLENAIISKVKNVMEKDNAGHYRLKPENK